METLDLKKLPKGWKVGTVAEFLELSPEESEMIELRLVLSRTVKARRVAAGLTQSAFARKIKSSQSRVAKIEAGDPSVAINLLVKSLIATGASAKEIGMALTQAK